MQQKMDALKEEKSPRTPDEEEPQDSEFAMKPVEEVRSLESPLSFSSNARRTLFRRAFRRCE